MSNKVRANLYLEEDLYNRLKAVLESKGDSVSNYFNHTMREEIDLLEAVAQATDYQQAEQLVKEQTVDKMTKTMADEFLKASEFMRTLSKQSEEKEAAG